MRPISRPGLDVLASDIYTAPGRLVASYIDAWGTNVDLVETNRPSPFAEYTVTALVETGRPYELVAPRPDESQLFRLSSARVPLDSARQVGWQPDAVGHSWEAVEAALAWIPTRFGYQVGMTSVSTTLEEFVALGSGVCQDFAHAFLSLVRSWGWCARYVSGYVFVDSAGGMLEAEAMHAWVEVYRPDAGWIGLDATTGRKTDDRYIAVGMARDYDDVRPVRGVVDGAARQAQEARLHVAVVSQESQ
jgi:transglutaminase-like putative cysteine protease